MNLKKISILLLISIILLSVSSSIGFADRSSANEEIKMLIEEYFSVKKNIYINQNLKDIRKLDELFSTEMNSKEKEAKRFKFLIKDMQLKRRKYSDIKIILTFNNINIINNSAIVNVTEYNEMTHSDNIITKSINKHEIYLLNKNGNWYIKQDKYSDLLSEQLESVSYDIEHLLSLSYENINKLKNNHKYLDDDNNQKNNSISMLTLGSYNRTNALNYVEDYWNYTDSPDNTKYNPNYINFEQYPGNYDCTNFVSQVLRAGGISDDKNGSENWYYSGNNDTNWLNDNWTSSWTGVTSFYNYIVDNTDSGGPNVTVHDNFSNYKIKEGDIIQFELTGDSTWDHSTVITGTYSTYYGVKLPLLTYHSGPEYDKKFEDMGYKDYRIIEINGENQ